MQPPLCRMVNLASVLVQFPPVLTPGIISVSRLSWEEKLGYLKAEKCLVPAVKESLIVTQPRHVQDVLQLALGWLAGEEEEVGRDLSPLSSH